MAHTILSLPFEVLHLILVNCDPQALAPLRCCRFLRDFIENDRLLIQELYLKNFDDPRSKTDEVEPSWEADLHKLVRTRKIFESDNVHQKKAHLDTVTQSMDHLLNTAAPGSRPSLNVLFLAQHFLENQQNINAFICGSSLFKWAEWGIWKHPPDFVYTNEEEEEEDDDEEEESGGGGGGGGGDGDEEHEQKDEPAGMAFHTYVLRRRSEQSPASRIGRVGSVRIPSEEEARNRRLSAKLHSLYGVPVQDVRRSSGSSSRYSLRSDVSPIHPYARATVYDLRQHNEHNFWGPFMDDGSQNVDWEKIESIMVLLGHNTKIFAETHEILDDFAIPSWNDPFAGASPYSYVSRPNSIPMEPPLPLEAQDPYNITGIWMRIVCFLDYTELYQYNFARERPPATQPQIPLDAEEAIRLITMKIRVIKITPPGEKDGKGLPVIHFKGVATSLRPSWDPNANSEIRGTVKLTPEGEVRWTTWSIFHGEERWRSEGIQVGGVQSARGVLGFWFDKDYEDHGPAGPTAFWKSHDGIEATKPSASTVLHNGIHGLHSP